MSDLFINKKQWSVFTDVERNEYDSRGNLYSKILTEYDIQGNEIEYKIIHNGKLEYVTTFKYVYDENGNWIEQIEFKDNKPQRITEREYVYYKYYIDFISYNIYQISSQF